MIRELPTLWQQACASSCHAYSECGGAASAPCGCAFIGTDGAYLCDECWLNCRDRRGSEPDDVGERHYNEGLALNDLRIATRRLNLPALLPAVTCELPCNTVLPAVAAGIDDLFCRDPRSRLRPSPRLNDPGLLRSHLRCAAGGEVIGVLNATDAVLELLWNTDPSEYAQRLVTAGLTAITGPTFSVLGETGPVTPYHNLTMLRRHHRVVQRLFDHGLEVVPNLYWRTQAGMQNWADVLRRSDINMVSRDFSRTKSGPQFEAHLAGLLDLLKAVDRPMRVIVVGVGVRKAMRTSEQIQGVGCSSTIITADPVRLAVNRGAQVFRRGDGELAIRTRYEISREKLALRNIITLSRELGRLNGRRQRRTLHIAGRAA